MSTAWISTDESDARLQETPKALPSVTWAVTPPETPVDYLAAVSAMEARIAAIHERRESETVWLLEHPALYTAGTSAKPDDLLTPHRFPVFTTGRGGQYTYHGPGQQIAYVMLDVKTRFHDVRRFVSALEHWLVDALAAYSIAATTHRDRVGVWVPIDAAGQHPPDLRPENAVTEAKVAALGVRLKRWVSMHGVALNVHVDLSHFDGIVPCGITEYATTSLSALGRDTDRQRLVQVLRSSFETTFGATTVSGAPPLGASEPAQMPSSTDTGDAAR